MENETKETNHQTQEVIVQLEKLPKIIEQRETLLLAKKQKYDELLMQQKYLENEVAIKVKNEKESYQEEVKVNKQGWTREQREAHVPTFETKTRDRYSSQFIRDIETSKRLKVHGEYSEKTKIITSVKRNIESEEIQLKYLSRRFRSLESIAYLLKA